MKTVSIVAMGESRNVFIIMCLLSNNKSKDCPLDDDIWAINYMATIVDCDRCIAMDPLIMWNEIAHPKMVEKLKKANFPIITSKKYEEFPTSQAYPLKEVIDFFGYKYCYFNNTVPYAIALAIFEGYERIKLWGVDYLVADKDHNVQALEDGRSCLEFWINEAIRRGIQVILPNTSSVLGIKDATNNMKCVNEIYGEPVYGVFYGYHELEKINMEREKNETNSPNV